MTSSWSEAASGCIANSSKRDAVREGWAVPFFLGLDLSSLHAMQVQRRKLNILTRSFFTAINGAALVSVFMARASRAFLCRPAPGIHQGIYFTSGHMSGHSGHRIEGNVTNKMVRNRRQIHQGLQAPPPIPLPYLQFRYKD